jgi:multidrug resistance efflux pump
MVQSGVLDEVIYQEVLKRYEALQQEIGETEAMIQLSRDRARSLTDQAGGTQRPDEEFSGLLLPLQQGMAAQQARILEVQTRRATRVLRSSVAGTVTQIFHRAGDAVSAGSPLMMISNKEVTTIIAFVDEGAASRIEKGAEVKVYPRTVPGTTLLARVARIGTSMVERPVQVRQSQGTLEWGVPVLLTQMSEQALFPGQVVDLRLATN